MAEKAIREWSFDGHMNVLGSDTATLARRLRVTRCDGSGDAHQPLDAPREVRDAKEQVYEQTKDLSLHGGVARSKKRLIRKPKGGDVQSRRTEGGPLFFITANRL